MKGHIYNNQNHFLIFIGCSSYWLSIAFKSESFRKALSGHTWASSVILISTDDRYLYIV